METTNKRAFNMVDACSYIGGISRAQMYKLIGLEGIRSYTIGNRRYFLKEELDKFLERMAEGR
jgi:hypothetical protein